MSQYTTEVMEAELIESGGRIDSEQAAKKPVKCFIVQSIVYSDGVTTTLFYELCQVGRKKNQKVLYRKANDFLSRVELVLPYCATQIKDFCETVDDDNRVIDMQESERIAEMEITLWSDAYCQKKYTEIVKGDRGSPQKSIVSQVEFIDSLKQQVGSAGSDLVKLLN